MVSRHRFVRRFSRDLGLMFHNQGAEVVFREVVMANARKPLRQCWKMARQAELNRSSRRRVEERVKEKLRHEQGMSNATSRMRQGTQGTRQNSQSSTFDGATDAVLVSTHIICWEGAGIANRDWIQALCPETEFISLEWQYGV